MKVSLARLPDFAADFVSRLPKSAPERACVVGLRGELGAGKTAFVQEVAKVLGVAVPVPSPTYVLAQRFPITHGPFRNLIHIDAYRLSPEEKDTFGWSGYVADPENVVLVEWPERLPGGAPAGMPLLEFVVAGEDTREIQEKNES